MFFSHQLLARKAPLGQIWMAATMHAKLNRRNLNKLNLVKICEEILNPSVPMALRLSGILMGGVVIVYERKVKLLYDDVSRLLVEINEAWKVKPTSTDQTVLPRGKTQAKFEAVTLPYNDDTDAAGEVEQPLHKQGVQRGGFPMQLDDVEDAYININPGEDESMQQHHQADPANITLFGDVDSYMAETDLYNRFERFDIDGEDETNLNFTSHEHPEIPTTLMPSPPPPDAPPQDVGMQDHQPVEPEDRRTGHTNEVQEEEQEMQRQPPLKRKTREKHPQIVMDIDQIIIPGAIYQSWLKDASDLVSDRGSRRRRFNLIRSSKISTLMEIPPVGLFSSENTSTEIHYPAPLMELWQKCTRTTFNLDAASERIPSPRQPRQPSHSTSGEAYHQEPSDFPGEDFPSEMGSQTIQVSIEKLRANLNNINIMTAEDVLMGDNIVTPGSPSLSAKSNPNSSSGHATLPMDPEVQLPSGRSKRRQNSSKHSTNSLDPVEEDAPWHESGRDPKLRKVSEYELAPDLELLEETGPTQTPLPNLNPSIDKTTQSIRTHLKLHFDTPGNPQVESLDSLASGMNRRRAAMLFYQTCVLATCDYVKVEQSVPYGEIFLSKGPNM